MLNRYKWIDLLVAFLSFCSIFAIIKSFIAHLYLLSEYKRNLKFFQTWDGLSLYQRLKYFNLWMIMNFVGNSFQLSGSILNLWDHSSKLRIKETAIGFGCFFAWIGVIKFLNDSKSYTIADTLERSYSTIGPYIIGIIPIFMGYVLFAVCAFWQTGMFPDVFKGMIVGFSIINGDSVYTLGNADFGQNTVFGLLFYYSFAVFFIW